MQLDGNKTNALGTLAAAWGVTGFLPETIAQIPEPTTGMLLMLMGAMFMALRHSIAKLAPNKDHSGSD